MYYEDYYVGQEFPLKSVDYKADEMIAFAEKYDSRDFHLSAEGAKGSIFSGLAASGLYTLVTCWGRWTEAEIDRAGLICGMEVEWNKWLKPVYAGDRLDIVVNVREKVETSKEHSGVVKFHLKAHNQHGDLAMDSSIAILIKKRD